MWVVPGAMASAERPAGAHAAAGDAARRGYRNRGSTCYQSAVLQALSALGAGTWSDLLAVAARDRDSSRVNAAVVARFPHLATGGQHDAHEWLCCAVESLDIERRFRGTRRTRVRGECGHTITRDEAFVTMSVPVLPTLARAVDCFTRPATVTCVCDACGASGAGALRASVERWPDVLVVQWLRFDASGRKLTAPTSTEAAWSPVAGVRYGLVAYVTHAGASPVRGHYTATVAAGGRWWVCDDDVCSPVSTPARMDRAYLLFYARVP